MATLNKDDYLKVIQRLKVNNKKLKENNLQLQQTINSWKANCKCNKNKSNADDEPLHFLSGNRRYSIF